VKSSKRRGADSRRRFVSTTEEEEEAVVVPVKIEEPSEEDSEEDLADDESWKKDYPEFNTDLLSSTTGSTSQPNSRSNSQSGSQQHLSLSQRQQQHSLSITTIKPTLPSLPNASSPTVTYRPVEATPYTPEQLARGALQLTSDPNGPRVPQPLNRLLREYQREGVRFLYQCWEMGRGGILGDDMGLGKTIQGESRIGMREVEEGRVDASKTNLTSPSCFAVSLTSISSYPSRFLSRPTSQSYPSSPPSWA